MVIEIEGKHQQHGLKMHNYWSTKLRNRNIYLHKYKNIPEEISEVFAAWREHHLLTEYHICIKSLSVLHIYVWIIASPPVSRGSAQIRNGYNTLLSFLELTYLRCKPYKTFPEDLDGHTKGQTNILLLYIIK